MKQRVKNKIIGILLFLAVYIAFPFFKIDYFETTTPLLFIYIYLLIPIILISTVGTIIWYKKYLRQLNAPTNSKIKKLTQDIVTVTFLTCIAIGIICAMTLSTIVTTNAYLEPQKTLTVKESVIEYEPYTTKYGRLRHYIVFVNPTDLNQTIRLEVYRKYKVGEIFIKDMHIGKWGLLYSMD